MQRSAPGKTSHTTGDTTASARAAQSSRDFREADRTTASRSAWRMRKTTARFVGVLLALVAR